MLLINDVGIIVNDTGIVRQSLRYCSMRNEGILYHQTRVPPPNNHGFCSYCGNTLSRHYQTYILFYAVRFIHPRTPVPKKRQRLTDKPTEEVTKKLFPKKVVEKVNKVAHEKDDSVPTKLC
jgi:hypothetical protein